MSEDLYTVLNISKDSSLSEIKSAYRKLAVKYHPDKNPDNKEAAEYFMKVTKAYNVLSDTQKRAEYDQEKVEKKKSYSAGRSSKDSSKFNLASALRTFMNNIQGEELFENQFYGQKSNRDGDNLKINLSVTLQEVLRGAKKKIKIKRYKPCEKCQGRGSAGKTPEYETCPQCNGIGKVKVVGKNKPQICNSCSGEGKVLKDACSACSGLGRIMGGTGISVKIPRGIAEGNILELKGMGHAGIRNGKPGDLLVFIKEEDNSRFKRDGDDLKTEVSVPLVDMILGGNVTIADLKGDLHSFKIPEGSQDGASFKIKRYGLPLYKQDGYGDLYISVHAELPGKLIGEPLQAFKEFKAKLDKHNLNQPYKRVEDLFVVYTDNDKGKLQTSFYKTAEELAESGVALALDLSGVIMLDSMAMGLLAKLNSKLSGFNHRLKLLSVTEDVYNILYDCSLDQVFDIQKDTGFSIENEDYQIKKVKDNFIVYAGKGSFNESLFNGDESEDLIKGIGNSVGLDLKDIDYINSKNISAWIKAFKKAKENNSEVFLLNPTKKVFQILEETNLTKLFRIVDKIEDL